MPKTTSVPTSSRARTTASAPVICSTGLGSTGVVLCSAGLGGCVRGGAGWGTLAIAPPDVQPDKENPLGRRGDRGARVGGCVSQAAAHARRIRTTRTLL